MLKDTEERWLMKWWSDGWDRLARKRSFCVQETRGIPVKRWFGTVLTASAEVSDHIKWQDEPCTVGRGRMGITGEKRRSRVNNGGPWWTTADHGEQRRTRVNNIWHRELVDQWQECNVYHRIEKRNNNRNITTGRQATWLQSVSLLAKTVMSQISHVTTMMIFGDREHFG